MLDKEVFKDKLKSLISIIRETEEFIDKIDELGLDLSDSPLYIGYSKMSRLYEEELLIGDEVAIETFDWYLYEYLPSLKEKTPSEETARMWDKNKKPICYDFNSLCDFLNDIIKEQ